MPENQAINVYSFGFEYNSIVFCWHKKELYRMPYTRNKRSYNKRMLSQKKQGNSIGYCIDGDFKSMKILKQLTKQIKYEEIIKKESECPF